MSVTVGVKKFTVSTKLSSFLRESRFQNLGNLCWWNPEYSTSNPESLKRLESRIQVPLTKNLDSSILHWNTHIPRLSRIPFQGVTKTFDIALCNNGRLTLLNGSFCRKVSHIFVRYESFKVKFAAKLQSRLQLSLKRSKSNFKEDCTHFKRFWHLKIFLWRFFCFVCGVLCVEMKSV